MQLDAEKWEKDRGKTDYMNTIKSETPDFNINFSASATVEGALVIPLFIYAVVAIMYVLQIVAIRTRVNNCLYNTIRKFSVYTYIYEETKNLSKNDIEDIKNSYDDSTVFSSGLTQAAFLAMFIDEIGHDYAKNNNIIGQNAGWVIAESSILEEGPKIQIIMRYSIRNPFDIFGLGKITVSEKKVINAWMGEDYGKTKKDDQESGKENNQEDDTEKDNTEKDNKTDIMVYITTSGKVYHTNKTCTYLSRNINSCTYDDINLLRNLEGARYYPCSVCNKTESSGIVYYTDYGDRYHASSYCRELTRVILTVPLSSVPDRKPCSKCAS